ncbi:MAG: FAD-binding protein, partial [Gemmatimonadota bacterium]|nr:FAD-binding protein [Gemmatimonadota bacterium]
FETRFPGVTKILADHGLDPHQDLIPVAPALHYAMGGIRTDLDGRTTREGLWAVGEVACTGVHGANRLASNSLLEGMVFADRVARSLSADLGRDSRDWPVGQEGRPRGARSKADYTIRWQDAVRARTLPAFPGVPPAPADAVAEEAAAALLAQMRETMTNDVGLVRTEEGLRRADRTLKRLTREAPPEAWRAHNQLLVARLITHAALSRRESRGGHRRLDYPPPARAGRTRA